jgi:HAD superfamily hydrolase (TIGR01509 family)
MYWHMIWDFDGTLFDTYEAMGKALQQTFQENGIHEPLEEIIRCMKISISEALKYYKEKYRIDDAFIQSYQATRREMELEHSKPYPGVLELLRYGKETGRCNYLLTHRGETSIAFLQRYSVFDCFTECITSRNNFERKPSPAGILYLMDKYRIRPEEAIMIGDRELDILSGKNTGIDACFFDESGLSCKAADYNIRSMKELYEIIGEQA